MNGQVKNEPQAKSHIEQQKTAAPPKRFVFDVSSQQETSSQIHLSKSFHTPVSFPKIHDFPSPVNLKEAYDSLCKSILITYNEICQKISNIPFEGMQEFAKVLKIQKPIDCVKFFKDVLAKFCGKLGEISQKGDPEVLINEYEKLLQQSETKIRDLIRNEQIYRLNFEQLTTKSEEAEKVAVHAQNQMEESKMAFDNLTKESNRLAQALQYKDEELRSMMIERQAYLQTIHSNVVATTSNTESPQISETLRTKNPNWNSNNLKMLLNDGRHTPTEFSRLIPNLDSSRANGIKSTSRTPTSSKAKTLQRSGTTIDMTSINVKNLKINEMDKFKGVDEVLKNNIGLNTERKKSEILKPSGLNQSTKGSESYGFISHVRGASLQTIGLFPEQTKYKQPARLKTRKDLTQQEDKSYSPTRIKQMNDFGLTQMKTDSFEDHGKTSMILDKIENNKFIANVEKPIAQKIEYTQNPNTSFRRRSGVAKTRPLMVDSQANSQKSIDQKSMTTNPRPPPGCTILSHRSISKGKSPMIDQGKNSKSGKNMSPFVNIMLKKFTDQEITSKKTL